MKINKTINYLKDEVRREFKIRFGHRVEIYFLYQGGICYYLKKWKFAITTIDLFLQFDC